MQLTNEQKDKLSKVAGLIKKAAAPDNTGFDEKPAAQKTGSEAKIQPESPKTPVKPTKSITEEPAAVPQENENPQEETPQSPTMQDVMSISARGFLGPEIFDAAMQGDPNAQNMIALTAANVAAKMGEIYMRQGAMRMAAEAEQEQPAEQQPPEENPQEGPIESNTQQEAHAAGAKEQSPRQQTAV